MVRVKRGNIARKRRKKILSLASGYKGAHSILFRIANQQVMKALRYSYIGRKQKKRVFRKLWIGRINAASRLNGLSYSQLIHKFKKSNMGFLCLNTLPPPPTITTLSKFKAELKFLKLFVTVLLLRARVMLFIE